MAEDKTVMGSEAPVRTKPLPFEFPGMHYYDDQEIEAYQAQNRKDLTDATLPAKGATVAVLYVDDKLYRLL